MAHLRRVKKGMKMLSSCTDFPNRPLLLIWLLPPLLVLVSRPALQHGVERKKGQRKEAILRCTELITPDLHPASTSLSDQAPKEYPTPAQNWVFSFLSSLTPPSTLLRPHSSLLLGWGLAETPVSISDGMRVRHLQSKGRSSLSGRDAIKYNLI